MALRSVLLRSVSTAYLFILGAFGQNDPSIAPDVLAGPPLSAQQLAYGRQQVDAVLRDRPQLKTVVVPGNEIDTWLVRAFAAPELTYKIAWSTKPNPPGFPGECSSSTPINNVAYVEVNQDYVCGPEAHQPQVMEDVLSELVFELNNVRNADFHAKLYLQACLRQISRDDYIIESARAEHAAFPATTGFFYQIWVPYCKAHQLNFTPSRWKANQSTSFEEFLAEYPRGSTYPWQIFGKRYDKWKAGDFKQSLSLAEKGDVAAELIIAKLNYYGRNYAESVRWYGKAAKQGNVRAQQMIAWLFLRGIGTSTDAHNDFTWAVETANEGNPQAAKLVGYLYEHGIGVKTDPAQARQWDDKEKATGK